MHQNFKGLRTVVYQVDDLAAAKTWYSDALGIAPYFDESFYVGFNVAGYELGLSPREGPPAGTAKNAKGSTDAVAYWGVDDVPATLARLQALGATIHEAAHEVGGGIVVGTLLDPFNNPLGLIDNPHFKL